LAEEDELGSGIPESLQKARLLRIDDSEDVCGCCLECVQCAGVPFGMLPKHVLLAATIVLAIGVFASVSEGACEETPIPSHHCS
jgi:hypothetical protein